MFLVVVEDIFFVANGIAVTKYYLTCFVTHDFYVNWRKKCSNSIPNAPIVRLPIVYAFP
jgi:hypothetical protein